MAELATIIVVPRQRFSVTARTLEALHAATPSPFNLVYVDGGSPAPTRRYLSAKAREWGFRLIRTEEYLSPNEARNLGVRATDTRYVVFIDNDSVASPGWLQALVACAEETGAWVVGPLVFIGEPLWRRVHIAGGVLRLEETPTGRRLIDRHEMSNRPYEDVAPTIVRRPCGFVEFHAMLVRRDVFDRLGLLDEQLLSGPEHFDLCLQVLRAGGSIWIEPEARVNYLPAKRLTASDVRFYMLRWSDAWSRRSLSHLREKWGLDGADPFLDGQYYWMSDKRMRVLGPAWALAKRTLGYRRSLAAAMLFERWVTGRLVRREEWRRTALATRRAEVVARIV
jgi:GT2 family glycosyltransferase